VRTLGKLAAVGGAQALEALTDEVYQWAITGVNAEAWARVVAGDAAVRRIARACSMIAHRAADPAVTADALSEAATRALVAAAPTRKAQALRHHEHDLAAVLDRVEGGDITRPGHSTGFDALDRIIKSLGAGRVYVIAGRPAMGKSAFGQQVAKHLAATVGPALIFSLEMPREEIFHRGVAQTGMIPVDRVENPSTGDGAQRAEVGIAAQRYARLPIFVHDGASLTIGELSTLARLFRLRHPDLSCVLVDYLQLVKPNARGDNREREVAEVCEGLKVLAKELAVPVIALAQLNRSVEKQEDKRPGLADLRESGAIEQIADVAMFLYRDEYYHPDTADRGVAEVIVAKGRGCATGVARIGFTPVCAAFHSLQSHATHNPYTDEDM
jgi:replicative DNA helicase